MSGIAVSVIVPFFNAQAQLAQLLDTVFAQTSAPWELIIVDDASSPALEPSCDARLMSSNVRVIRHSANRGPAEARNTGLNHARGNFVALLDADDRWMPNKLSTQLAAALECRDPTNVFCVTKTALLYAGGVSRLKPTRPKQRGERADEYIYVHGEFAQSSSFFLGADLARKLRFRDIRQFEDHLFFIEAMSLGAEYCFVDQILTIYDDADRLSRASASRSIAHGLAYLEKARDLLSARAELAFRVRYIGALLFAKQPVETIRLLVRALRMHAIEPRFVATFLLRLALPAHVYRSLQRRVRTTRTQAS